MNHEDPISSKTKILNARFQRALDRALMWTNENGIVLPPPDFKHRNLRAWFNYYIRIWDTAAMCPLTKSAMTSKGLNIGLFPKRGSKEPPTKLRDNDLATRLVTYREMHGSYDLSLDAPKQLIHWQSEILASFIKSGMTSRLKRITELAPGLHIGSWLQPRDQISPAERQWWDCAKRYEYQSLTRGMVNPLDASTFSDWLDEQRERWNSGDLSVRQRIWLREVGLTNRHSTSANSMRLKSFEAQTGVTLQPSKGNSRSLSDMMGALHLIHCTVQRHSVQQVALHFRVDESSTQLIIDFVQNQLRDIPLGSFREDMRMCKAMVKTDPTSFTSAHWQAIGQPNIPTWASTSMVRIGRLAYLVRSKFGDLQQPSERRLQRGESKINKRKSKRTFTPTNQARPLSKNNRVQLSKAVAQNLT